MCLIFAPSNALHGSVLLIDDTSHYIPIKVGFSTLTALLVESPLTAIYWWAHKLPQIGAKST